MVLYSLYIINRAGGLIYQQNINGQSRLRGNDYLRLASTFHGFDAIVKNLSPTLPASGIQSIEAEHFRLQCFATVTGLKFFVIGDPNDDMEKVLQQVYELYSDYALKNPFYALDMPIRCELFDQNLQKILNPASGPAGPAQ